MFQTRVPCLHRLTDRVFCKQSYNRNFHSSDSSTLSNTATGNAMEAKGYGEREEIVGDPLNGFPILDRRFRSSVHLQSPSLKLFGITTDFQVAESMHFDGREADDLDVDGVAEQVLAAALAALRPGCDRDSETRS